MQTLTIRVDESYLEQILAFLQQIPKNKREIFQHTKLNLSPKKREEDEFLTILANGPTISHHEADEWEQNIKNKWSNKSHKLANSWEDFPTLQELRANK